MMMMNPMMNSPKFCARKNIFRTSFARPNPCIPDDVTPVLTSSSSSFVPPASPSEAQSTVDQAKAQFSNISARIEYCKWHGVDYVRTIKYVKRVRLLDACFNSDTFGIAPKNKSVRSTKKPRPVYRQTSGTPVLVAFDDDDLRVRIEGMHESTFMSLVNAGICPLCGHAKHVLAMCPMMPMELIPFC